MNENLKHCPFCGNKNVYLDCVSGVYAEEYWFIKCDSCGVCVGGNNDAKTAMEKWNRRAEVKDDADTD